mmetsp:Transcript_17376/g.40528  ORF Transcript_17376/g.40528 Transcript_17376/m.40528 type:complete len:304 (+) Transcript_17376:2519-3430(+)
MSCACMITRIWSRIACPALPPRPMVDNVHRIHMRHRGWAFHNSAMRFVMTFVVPASILGCVQVFFSHVKSLMKENRCHTKIQLQNSSLLVLISSSSGRSHKGILGILDHLASRASTCTNVLQDRSFLICCPSQFFSQELTKSKQFSYRRFKLIWLQVTSCSTILSATSAHAPRQRPLEENRTIPSPPVDGLIHSLPFAVLMTNAMPGMAGSTKVSPQSSSILAGMEKSKPSEFSPMLSRRTWPALSSTAVTPCGHFTEEAFVGHIHSPERGPLSTPKCSMHGPSRGCNQARTSAVALEPPSSE